MTALAAPPTDTAQPERPPPRRPDLIRRVGTVVALLAIALGGVAVLLASDTASELHGSQGHDVPHGIFRLPDGELLTLFGSPRSPRSEHVDEVTILTPRGTDAWESVTGSTRLAMQRTEDGAIAGLGIDRDGATPVVASPVRLHSELDVRFRSDGAELAATLLTPATPGPHPAVVIIHGAEPNADRNNYWLLGSHFARRGVAALIYDKRGVGASSGDFASATFDDLTADALAAVDAVAVQPDIDPDQVGVLGFSQGAWIAAKAAARSDAIAFVAAYSPSGFSPADQQAWLHGSMLTARGFDDSGLIVADRVSRMLYSSLDLVDAGIMPAIPHVPGFWFHAMDPDTDSSLLWGQVRQPTLLAWGALDCQVPAHDSMQALGDALHRGGNTDVTLAVVADADHSFTLVEPCGHETGLAPHGSVRFADGYFDLGPDWILAVIRSDRQHPGVPVAERRDATALGWHLDPPAPAPWYGSLLAQLTALLVLLGTYGSLVVRWVFALTRAREDADASAWLGPVVGLAGVAGVLAVLTGTAAFTEIAMLGDTHATFLLGGPTVAGISPLMVAARLLVVLTGTLGLATALGLGRRSQRTRWLLAAATMLLLVWAAYWRLLPLL